GARGFPLAPGEESANFGARAAVSAVSGVRLGGAAIGCGVGRDGAEVQFAGGARHSARIRAAVASGADHADSGWARWREEDVEEPGELCGDHGSAGRDVREADV